MKRAKLILVVVLLCPPWPVLGQQSDGLKISVQGGEAGQAPKKSNEQGAQPLTNDSIVKLVKAGLGEDTIISMVNTQPGKYSLGADDIIALKKAGVPEKVITAMVSKPASDAPNAPASPARLPEKQAHAAEATATAPVPPDTTAPAVNEVGVYYKKGEAWVQVMPEVVNWQTGGVIKSLATVNIVKGDVNGRIDGPTSRNLARSPLEFLIYLQEGVEITEYQLVHLRQHHDSREFRTVTGGVFHQSGGAKRDTLPFEYKKIGTRTYLVPLADLGPGEYGFLAPGAGAERHASAQLGKMYTFHLLE